MRFVVCVKEVPDTTEIRIDPETNTLIREGVPAIINPFDMYAVEMALEARESYGGEVIVVSMGPPKVENNLRNLLAMGVDKAILLSDKAFAGADTWATSNTLSTAIRKIICEFDLILVGRQATDGDTGQVGPGIAEFLGIPQGMYVRKIISLNEVRGRFERIIENGTEIIELPLPALISVVKGEKEPRLPSLRGMLRSKKETIPIFSRESLEIPENDCGLKGSPTRVIKVFTPPQRSQGKLIVPRSKDEAVEFIINCLKENQII